MAARDVPPPRPAYGARDADARHWDAPAEPDSPSRLADSLEPGPLRDELRGAGAAPPFTTMPDTARIATLRFTGDGAEYFRIWVVNLLLTLATVGVYSAWAKVRKARYFWQNTRLDGHAFDYHGNPVSILVGRIVALVLLVAYSIAFDISRTAGLVMVAVLCLAGPWLFLRAQRFKLVNSSWRGLRFGFDANVGAAYRAVLPPLLIWFSGTIVASLAAGRIGLLALVGVVTPLMFPWMHHRIKAYQHRAARYGDRRFDFLPATRSFYAVYFKAALLATLAAMVAFTLLGLGSGAAAGNARAVAVALAVTVIVALLGYLAAWPYFAARLQAVVWSHTRLGDVRFSTSIEAWPLVKLIAKNVLLTAISAGLYWPFAAIALARYRVECMRAECREPISALAASVQAAPGPAAGDAAIEAFGLDIGL